MTFLMEKTGIVYPESDGKPVAENTLQFLNIEMVKGGCEALLRTDPMAFIVADLLWYPVEGNNRIATAPDTMVVFGRPKRHRRSYLQWQEENTPPQVVFEILSHTNTASEMAAKMLFYNQYGVDAVDTL